MKKKRILLLVILLPVLLVAGLYVTRNQWVALALKRTVAARSHGQIAIGFQSVEVGVFSKTLTLEAPVLRFQQVYFDKAAGTMLKKTLFHRLVLTNISLLDVVLHRQFLIEDLLLEKPEFILSSAQPVKKGLSSGFDPAKLIEVMQNHQVAALRFAFLVKHTHIQYGKIHLNGKKGSKIYGRAHYSLSIKNMGTIRYAGDTLHPLFFQDMELAVRDFHRYSAPEKMDISLDSAFYFSKNKTLFLRGLHVDLLGKKPQGPPLARIFIRWANIKGMKTRKPSKGRKSMLRLGELKVVGGNIVLPATSSSRKKNASLRWLKSLFASYALLSLDTVDIRHIHWFWLGKTGDTLAALHRVNLSAGKLWADKNVLRSPLKSVHFSSLQTSLSKMAIGDEKKSLQITAGKSGYDTHSHTLRMQQLLVKTKCNADSGMASVYAAKSVRIGNLYAGKLQQGKKQPLSIELEEPHFFLKTDSTCRKNSRIVLPALLKPLVAERLKIINGRFDILEPRRLAAGLGGVDFFADSLEGTSFKGPRAALRFDSLFFRARKSYFTSFENHQTLKTGALSWSGKVIKVSGLLSTRRDSVGYDSLGIGRLVLWKLQPNALLFHKRFTARAAYLYKARYVSFRKDTIQTADILPEKHWNRFVPFPVKTRIGYLQIRQSSFSLAKRRPQGLLKVSSRLDLKLHRFQMGYDPSHLFSVPGKWEAVLRKTKVQQGPVTVNSEKIKLNSDSATLSAWHVRVDKDSGENMRYHVRIPSVAFHSVRFGALFRSDSLIFGKVTVQSPQAGLQWYRFVSDTLSKKINKWHFVFDSIQLTRAQLSLQVGDSNRQGLIRMTGLNLLYHPDMLRPGIFKKTQNNLLKRWDFSLEKMMYSNAKHHFNVVADRVALQALSNRLHIKKIIGTNFTPAMTLPGNNQNFVYFLVTDMSLNNLLLSNDSTSYLHIRHWVVPGAWVNIISNRETEGKRSLGFLKSNFFSDYTRFLGGIHVDSSLFKNVNVSYQYDGMNKLVNIVGLAIHIRDIQMGEPFLPDASDALFKTMYVNLNDRLIISGDSMYAFRMRDIRVNLPERKIRFDSITLTPRYHRDEFFRRAGYQTDRITLYGKSAEMDRFHPEDLINGHYIHFGKLQLNNLSVRFERDMHYPRREVLKPMPIDMLHAIPYKFRFDSVRLNNNMLSYFEYEVKSKNPGIFFIDHFNVLAQNVTNHLMPDDSNLVLKFKGSGKLMKQTGLDFTLVMPYFAPRQQWWFSAEAGKIDLTQFNPLTENVLGISVISGIGSLQVPMITGDTVSARGSVDFLYHKLKLRLYNRKKSQQSKSVISPFANFFMNSLVVKSNNPPFLGHVKKGVVYFRRVPEKSFINYLWKSNLSGILSTIGINNKQQREVKREDKKQTKITKKAASHSTPKHPEKQIKKK